MDYRIVKLSDIDFSRLKLVKESTTWIDGQDHSRWVFKEYYHGSEKNHALRYIKVWNPQYVRKNNIIQALEIGFYDETTVSALQGLIFHQGVCRGYITEACKLTCRMSPEFYQLLKEKTAKCNYFAIQLSRYHIGRHKGRYSLIDLEGVHPIKQLPLMHSMQSFFDDSGYGFFVMSRFSALYSENVSDLGNCDFIRGWTLRSRLSEAVSWVPGLSMLKLWKHRMKQWLKIAMLETHEGLIEI